jgi:hypothetical protein
MTTTKKTSKKPAAKKPAAKKPAAKKPAAKKPAKQKPAKQKADLKQGAVDAEFEIISEIKEEVEKAEEIWVGEGDSSRSLAVASAESGNTLEITPNPDGSKHQILLLHWNGRFGNRMHQYAYGVSTFRMGG